MNVGSNRISETESRAIDKGFWVVSFLANWAKPCKTQECINESICKDPACINVATVDIDECPVLSERFDIRAVPTTVVLRDGIELCRRLGVTNAKRILNQLVKHC